MWMSYICLVWVSAVWVVASFSSKKCRKLTCDRFNIYDKEKEAMVSLYNDTTLKRLMEEERKNFRNKTVRVIVSKMMPYVTFNKSSQTLGGYLGDIWAIVQDRYKFRYVVESVEYDRALEMVESAQADILLAAVVYKENLKNIYYSHPYFYNWYQLYLKSPKGRPLSSLYLKTFDAKLWIFSCLVFVLLTTTVWCTNKLLNAAYDLEPRISVPSCFLGIVSGFINQGFDLKLRSYSGRLQVMVALMFGVVLYFALNAALVAKIAIFEAPYPFNSLQDVSRKSFLSLCLRTGSFVYNNFTDENKEILPEWQGVLNNNNCPDINDPSNIQKIICNDNVVVLENKVIMTSMSKTTRYSCTIEAFKDKYFRTGNSFLMLRAFKEKKLIDNYILHMRSVGVLQRLEQKWVENKKSK
ncbi:hypothetical protein NQ315_012720 [Exocentrus adspersus]|uniref:Uncharacterized protein n=1 Tax=Exocentrus adspersus TaxID=1586481 RepID=A0AAV8VSI9_9CUCU|nr:hypothetical protein NQ315_012720 [Exocentrus adspersus]